MRLLLIPILFSFLLFFVFVIIYPTPQMVVCFVLFIVLIAFVLLKQEYIVYISIFLVFFPFHLRYFGTVSNGIICLLVFVLFVRNVFEQRTVISENAIFKNPFLILSLWLCFCYFFSLVLAVTSGSRGISFHLDFVISMFCILLFGNILIGFITSRERLKAVVNIFLLLLLLNLLFGMITLVDPNFKLLANFFESSTVEIGAGLNRALRLGGLNFGGEAYGEYLMLCIIFITGILIHHKQPLLNRILLSLVLFISIIELLLTNTRGAILGTILGLSLLILFNKNYNFFKKINFVLVGLVIIFFALLFAHMTGYLKIKERFSDVSVVITKYGPMPKPRAVIWVKALDKVFEDKFLGSGPSLYPYTIYYNYRNSSGGTKINTLTWPHNSSLLILETIGFYGFLMFLVIFVRLFMILKESRKLMDPYIRSVFSSLIICLVALLFETQKYGGAIRQANS